MIQRSIDIDPDKCEKVARMLGTTCDRDTIDQAFDLLLSRGGIAAGVDRRFLNSVTSGHYADLFDERVKTAAWW